MQILKSRFCLITVFLLHLSSCKLPVSPRASSDPAGAEEAKTGGISISIPCVAPWLRPLAELASIPDPLSSRAYLHADQAKIELLTGNEPVIPAFYTEPVQSDAGQILLFSTVWGIPAGHGYRLRISVYNKYFYNGPSVVGETLVDIEEGRITKAKVSCLPNPDRTLMVNEKTCRVQLNEGGEAWYRFNAVKNDSITIAQEFPNCPSFLFDSQGKLMSTITSASGAFSFTETSDAVSHYYLGTAALASGSNGLSVTRARLPANEGTLDSPMQLSIDAPDRMFTIGTSLDRGETSYYSFRTNSIDTRYYLVADSYQSKSIALGTSNSSWRSWDIVQQESAYSSSEWYWDLKPSTMYYLKLGYRCPRTVLDYDVPITFRARLIGETEAIRLGRVPTARRLPIDTPLELRGNGHQYADDVFEIPPPDDPSTFLTACLNSTNSKYRYYISYNYQDGEYRPTQLQKTMRLPLKSANLNNGTRLVVYARAPEGQPTAIRDLGTISLEAFTPSPLTVGLGRTVLKWKKNEPTAKWIFPTTPGRTYRVELLDLHLQPSTGFSDLEFAAYDASGRNYFPFVGIVNSSNWSNGRPVFTARDTSAVLVFESKSEYGKDYGAVIEEVPTGSVHVSVD